MNLGLQVGADGGLQVVTGLPDQGGGQLTLIRRVLAAAASVDESRITFVKRTTIDTPGDPGVGGSWVTHMASRAAQQLGERLREWVDEKRRDDVVEREGLAQVPGYAPDTYPFTAQAFDSFCQYLTNDPRDAKPREILERLNRIAGRACLNGVRLITRDELQRQGIAP